jgi:signal transduction histidine kinase/DNA-directed RNA polymerase subunit N (RpoN/RPB10)
MKRTPEQSLKAQNAELLKELEIEAALEQVRSRAMAMHTSDELQDVVIVVLEKLQALEIPLTSISINTFIEGSKDVYVYACGGAEGGLVLARFRLPYFDHPIVNDQLEAWEKGLDFFAKTYSAKDKNSLYEYLFEYSDLKDLPAIAKDIIRQSKSYTISMAPAKNSAIVINDFDGKTLSEKEIDILKRFAKVFEQAYIRFLDLQKAETQAREAQIELALERVRARTMAMYHSEELAETAAVLFEHLSELGSEPARISIGIMDQEKRLVNFWATDQAGDQINISFTAPLAEKTTISKMYAGWQAKKKSLSIELEGKELAEWVRFCRQDMGIIVRDDLLQKRRVHTVGYFPQGWINYTTHTPPSSETTQILERFATMFSYTYTRFLDLQKAETQAREAQIELALERVRARTMAMQKSGELKEIIKVVYEQLIHLNILAEHAGFIMDYQANDDMHIWLADKHFDPSYITVPYFDSPHWNSFVKAKEKGIDFFANLLTFEVKNKFYRDLFELVPGVTDEARDYYFGCPGLAGSTVLIDNVGLYIENFSGIPYKDEENSTLMRFGKVFQQTYTRFKDLEQAEEQTKETQIQLALERVRARTMAMQKSVELGAVIQAVFEQFILLGVGIDSAGFVMDYKASDDLNLWIAVKDQGQASLLHIPYIDHPITKLFIEAREKGLDFYPVKLTKEEKNAWIGHLVKYIPGVPDEQKEYVYSLPGYADSHVLLKDVVLYIQNYTGIPYTDAENAMLMRFGKVFEQTYTRFKDLEQAEEQAREAQIQLGLERVRARAMAMQSSDELAELVDIVFKELTRLDFGLTHCAIAIADADSVGLTLWQANSEPDQPPISFYRKSFDHPYPNAAYKEWKKRTPKWVYHLKGAEKKAMHDYYASSQETMNVPKAVKEGMATFDSIILSHSFNNFGYLRTDTTDPLSENNLDTVYRFAKAFDLCYTRFNDIKQAEAQAREAQIQLALERVRARTMAMQKSEELHEVIQLVFDQLQQLNFDIGVANFALNYQETDDLDLWLAVADAQYAMKICIPYFDHPVFTRFNKAKEKGGLFTDTLSKDEKNSFFKHFFKYTPSVAKERQALVFGHPGFARSAVFMKNTVLSIINYQGIPYSGAENNTLLRFGQVFDQTYTRFNDLKQAEAQAKEAQIQLALERVRARTMAMQHSEELAETATVLFQQLHNLGISSERTFIGIPNDDMRKIELWGTEQGGNQMSTRFDYEADATYAFREIYKAWQEKRSELTVILKGKNIEEHVNYVRNVLHMPLSVALVQKQRILYNAFFSKGLLMLVTPETQSKETLDILARFASVFDQTYTRFLDLEKAEAQVREAQIEASLEKVRSKAMAMHNSDDLASAASVVFTELKKLGITTIRCGVGLFSKEAPVSQLYSATNSKDSDALALIGRVDMVGHPVLEKIYNGWVNQEDYFPVLNGKELKAFYKKISPGMNMPSIPGGSDEKQYGHFLYFTEGALNTWAERPYSEPELKILDRFKSIISLTFRRYLDLKKAEAQAKEAQIQLGLERVRAAAMAMHDSNDVGNATALVFSELYKLGITTIRCGVCIVDGATQQMEVWSASSSQQGGVNRGAGKLDMTAHPLWIKLFNAWKQKKPSFTYELAGKELADYYKAITNAPDYHAPDNKALKITPDNTGSAKQYCNCFLFNEGCVFAFTQALFSPETSQVLEKFTAVFGLTYRRYLDLQKAEAQAREAQIEAALERVRSKTMAMHNSADVGETVTLMFNELVKLGVDKIARCGIAIPDNNGLIELWTAKLGRDEKEEIIIGHIDTAIHPMLDLLYDAWKSKQAHFEYILEGDDLTNYITALNNYRGYPIKYEIGAWGEKQYHNDFFFHEGMVFAFTFQPLSAEIAAIFKRFAGVFGQTYRRYLDLQKAEAAAREAQIEAALERVRSKTMAMHNSQDVGDTVGVMFHEFVKLGIEKMIRCGIGIMSHENRTMELWTAKWGENEKVNLLIGHLDMTIHKMLGSIYDAWKSKQSDFTYHLAGSDLVSYAKVINSYPDYPLKYDLNSLPPAQFFNDFSFNEGVVFAFTSNSLSDEIVTVLKRFAGVFGQTYRRYLDLQKAENQAREAQIEAALERVRSKAMAMRSSGDLNDTANTVFIELRKLGVDLVRCGLGLMEKETHISTIHAATNSDEGGSLEVLGNIDMNIHPVFEGIYSHWRKNEDYFPVLEGESLKAYYEKLHESGISVPDWKSGEKQYGYFLQFTYGSLYAWSGKQESEITIKTLKRFTSVISLTYTRYIELQKAESNTKEAVKQASLDRVRAEIASMRKRSDLERITPLIWDELTILGIPFIRCGVFIMDEEQQLIHTFLSTPDGKAIGAFHIPFDTSGNFEKMVDSWRNDQPYIDHWKEEAFSQFANALVKQGAISSKAQYMRTLPHEGVHLNFLPFLQGMLYVGNIAPLAEDNISLIQAVADAFSTAYARYEDFNKLEAAKQQVDNTLTDLKAAQTKLIQSEKMASLGELTAGIAHEIQNPLNFVNNFSEVNQEMIDELADELKAGNIEEALAIAADIKDNEQKINHHGKRADAIVKGMLQHSRTGGGEKQPTNINTLADEFMRLSYHGLRAKDKVFNAELVTHFDPDLPKISVIGQDIGRVLLNLFNNAFYAVNQKKKALADNYKPEVTVTTSTENGQVIIKVKDNGVGMPDAIKEKIMQPFFTTKPTGEGTGLGLSLTYDMVVKGHGGSIQVNSVEGEGSEFIIQLPTS